MTDRTILKYGTSELVPPVRNNLLYLYYNQNIPCLIDVSNLLSSCEIAVLNRFERRQLVQPLLQTTADQSAGAEASTS